MNVIGALIIIGNIDQSVSGQQWSNNAWCKSILVHSLKKSFRDNEKSSNFYWETNSKKISTLLKIDQQCCHLFFRASNYFQTNRRLIPTGELRTTSAQTAPTDICTHCEYSVQYKQYILTGFYPGLIRVFFLRSSKKPAKMRPEDISRDTLKEEIHSKLFRWCAFLAELNLTRYFLTKVRLYEANVCATRCFDYDQKLVSQVRSHFVRTKKKKNDIVDPEHEMNEILGYDTIWFCGKWPYENHQ